MKSRPAETAGALVGTTGLVAAIASGNYLAAGVAVAGYIPALVTWLVNNGGIRGALQALWGGKRRR